MRRALLALALLVLVAAGAAAAWFWNERRTGDVRGSPAVEFVTTDAPGATTRPQEVVEETPWPTFGFDSARTKFAPEFALRPPFRVQWSVGGRRFVFLEFPPVIGGGRLYLPTNAGRLLAIDAQRGKVVWRQDVRRCVAASPTIVDGVVYQTFMDPAPCRGGHKAKRGGVLIAFDAETGRELWRFRTGITESSPVVVGGIVYFGSWNGRVYAVGTRTHRPIWTFRTGDKVKAGVAVAKGTVYVGSYDGKVYALSARHGKLRWTARARGGLRGRGNFYATPAVAYGRVYVGNTDGKVYAFGARSGKLRWATSTRRYVYSSAAVWNGRMYAGSHDRRLRAFDAATGEVRWSFRANGPISGSPTVLAGVVYFSSATGRTYALDARTGKKLWVFRDGQYSPVVADGERVYLTGYNRLYALVPS